MDYAEFASELPADRAMTFRSAEENEETMLRMGVDQRLRQLGKGSFRADLTLSSSGGVDLFADRFSTAFSMSLAPPPGHVGLLFPLSASGRFLASGHRIANDKLVVFPESAASDIVAPDPAGADSISISTERFAEMVRGLCPRLECELKGIAVVEGDTARLGALRNVLVNLIAQPEEPAPEEVSNLVAETITWAYQSSHRWRQAVFTVNGAGKHIAKLAQSYIEEHYRDAVLLEDLCRVAGVGARTLQRCFREYFDVTVSSYLETKRLDAARRALARARSGETTVTEVALQHGINHLGRFSVRFREHFGESPRQTLAGGSG